MVISGDVSPASQKLTNQTLQLSPFFQKGGGGVRLGTKFIGLVYNFAGHLGYIIGDALRSWWVILWWEGLRPHPTDPRTDDASYRDAWTYLKTRVCLMTETKSLFLYSGNGFWWKPSKSSTGDATKIVLDFLDFPPFRFTFRLLYCTSFLIEQ